MSDEHRPSNAAVPPVGHVWLVGAGPGDPGLVTVAGLAALRRAEVVLYDRLAPPELLDEAPGALLIDCGKAPGQQALTQRQIHAALIEHGRAGRRVVRLKGGDPYVFGRGGEEAAALADAGVPCTVVPGITSAIAGLAAAGIPVTHRGVATSFAIVTGHEDPAKPTSGVDWASLARGADTLVVLMGVGRLAEIATALVAGGRDPRTPAALVQEATTAAQRVVEAPLAEIAEIAERAGAQPPALLVVGEVVRLRERLATAPRGPLAGRRVLVTRTRRQASTLAEALRAEGAIPVLLPAIELKRRVDPAAADAALAALRAGAYRWCVLTSANAVDAFVELLLERGSDGRSLAGSRLCAIGPATAEALAARGLRADLVPNEAEGAAVASALAREEGAALAGARVLLPRAEGAHPALHEGLRAAGARVDELTLYLAAPPAEVPAEAQPLLRAGAIEAVTLTSSSTARNLVALLGGDLAPLAGAVVVCIGPRTAETARDLGLTPHVVAKEHTVPGLVAALRGYLHSNGHSLGHREARAAHDGAAHAPLRGGAAEERAATSVEAAP